MAYFVEGRNVKILICREEEINVEEDIRGYLIK